MVNKKDIEKLVVQNKKSNLVTHWKDSQSYNNIKYSGEIRKNEVLLWRSTYFMRGSYPVFHIRFNQNNELEEIKIEKNPYHIFLNKIMAVFLIVIGLSMFLLGNFMSAILAILGFTIVGVLMHLLLFKSTKYETKDLIEELKNTIENIERLKKSEPIKERQLEDESVNEWSFSKIITRIVIYPFCVFIIWMSIIGLLPEGKIKEGILAIIAALAFPITDLLLLIKKTKFKFRS